ncbi:MAG TPA: SH3 domain-containing protein [Chloroflexia bacterium]|nr:SH3 domain-containing protein [Chloroflexia bacterium]
MRTKLREHGIETPRLQLTLRAMWVVLLLVLMVGASGAAHNTALAATLPAVGGKAVVVNTDGDAIRVRKGAGTEYARIGSVYEGQIVSILDGPTSDSKGDSWFKVEAPSSTGWISAEFLEGKSTPAETPAGKLTGTARVANTDGDHLRVRAAPTTGPAGTTLALLDPGTKVSIQAGPVTDDAGIVWYQIRVGDLTGWAMAQYLTQEEAAQTAEPASTNTQPAGGATSTLTQYRQWMEEARATYPYPQSVDKMWRVMMCESGGNPRASGGGGAWLGLFQYAPGTWAGRWNPYRTDSIWDAKSQIFATAKAWSIGMQSAWSCYYITAGR